LQERHTFCGSSRRQRAIINATVVRNPTFGDNLWLTAIRCAVFVVLAHGQRPQIKGLAAAMRP